MAIKTTPLNAKLQLKYENKDNDCQFSGIRHDLSEAAVGTFMAGVNGLRNCTGEDAILIVETQLEEAQA